HFPALDGKRQAFNNFTTLDADMEILDLQGRSGHVRVDSFPLRNGPVKRAADGPFSLCPSGLAVSSAAKKGNRAAGSETGKAVAEPAARPSGPGRHLGRPFASMERRGRRPQTTFAGGVAMGR